MGCNVATDQHCEPDESPYHPVDLTAFEIDTAEVPVRQYLACIDAGVCATLSEDVCSADEINTRHADRLQHPVNCINYYQARTLCEYLDRRLCSEAEWERAARGDDGRRYPWGEDEPSCDLAVMDDGGPGCASGTTAASSSTTGTSCSWPS